MSDALTDELTSALEKALLDEGVGVGSSIHSWECDYPDIYGPCSCVRQVAEEQATVITRLVVDAQAKAWDEGYVARLGDTPRYRSRDEWGNPYRGSDPGNGAL